MSRGIRKTGVLAIVDDAYGSSSYQDASLAKKDERWNRQRKTLYGAYAVVGKSLEDPDIPDPEMEGIAVGAER